jgi:hypothetical protein
MEKVKIQIKSVFGKLLFEYEIKNNSIRQTLIRAVDKGANLQGANLQGADLQGADLQGAYLRGADLQGAYLQGANLQGADLQGADLQGAYLRGADLQGADLQGANLQGADLQGADLQGANLQDADLNFYSVEFQRTRILPDGDIIGYKKAYNKTFDEDIIVTLLIPKEAKRSHAFGRKCRAEYAKVIALTGNYKKAYTNYSDIFVYELDKKVRPDSFDEDWQNECSNGIHFFITKAEAENW